MSKTEEFINVDDVGDDVDVDESGSENSVPSPTQRLPGFHTEVSPLPSPGRGVDPDRDTNTPDGSLSPNNTMEYDKGENVIKEESFCQSVCLSVSFLFFFSFLKICVRQK